MKYTFHYATASPPPLQPHLESTYRHTPGWIEENITSHSPRRCVTRYAMTVIWHWQVDSLTAVQLVAAPVRLLRSQSTPLMGRIYVGINRCNLIKKQDNAKYLSKSSLLCNSKLDIHFLWSKWINTASCSIFWHWKVCLCSRGLSAHSQCHFTSVPISSSSFSSAQLWRTV